MSTKRPSGILGSNPLTIEARSLDVLRSNTLESIVDASDEQRRAIPRLMDAETFARLEFWAWCAVNRQWFAAWVVGRA